MSQGVRVDPGAVPAEVVAGLRGGAVVSEAPAAVLELSGKGAVAALQGLLTNDLDKPGDGGFVYGALLTPKGMVLVEGWAARSGTRVTYTVPLAARERVLELWGRYVPPRLAKRTDQTDREGVVRVAGPRAAAVVSAAGLPVPEVAGRVVVTEAFDVSLEVARPGEAGSPPFGVQIIAPRASLDGLLRRLTSAGALRTNASGLELARILAGWPTVTAEVDEKTLPQEIRFDELAGVSYTKGCYTGQETVSRLHFRGHANRGLRGLVFDDEPATDGVVVEYQDREAGRLTSVAWLPENGGGRGAGRWIGLGVLRRDVTPGAMVRAAGVDARVVDLPFAPAGAVPA